MQCQRELLEVVAAVGPATGLACRLHRRQEQANHNGDDRDDHQELDHREAPGKTQAGGLRGPEHGTIPDQSEGTAQIFTVPSWLPEAMWRPSTLNAMLRTQLVWP